MGRACQETGRGESEESTRVQGEGQKQYWTILALVAELCMEGCPKARSEELMGGGQEQRHMTKDLKKTRGSTQAINDGKRKYRSTNITKIRI